MNDNFFAEFPNQILQLVNVEYLNISRNRIQRIPGAWNNLDALTLLVMTENPWEDWSAIDELVLILRSRGVYVHVSPRDETAEDY
jgi:Leucine-rich repeat (LRR) protein